MKDVKQPPWKEGEGWPPIPRPLPPPPTPPTPPPPQIDWKARAETLQAKLDSLYIPQPASTHDRKTWALWYSPEGDFVCACTGLMGAEKCGLVWVPIPNPLSCLNPVPQQCETREISEDDAKAEILALFKSAKPLYYDWIADALNLPLRQVVDVCNALETDGLIGEPYLGFCLDFV